MTRRGFSGASVDCETNCCGETVTVRRKKPVGSEPSVSLSVSASSGSGSVQEFLHIPCAEIRPCEGVVPRWLQVTVTRPTFLQGVYLIRNISAPCPGDPRFYPAFPIYQLSEHCVWYGAHKKEGTPLPPPPEGYDYYFDVEFRLINISGDLAPYWRARLSILEVFDHPSLPCIAMSDVPGAGPSFGCPYTLANYLSAMSPSFFESCVSFDIPLACVTYTRLGVDDLIVLNVSTL